MSLPHVSVRRPVATAMLFLALLLLGIISLQQLRVDLFPELNYPRLLVRTPYQEAAPQEVMEMVTRPIEEAVSAVSGLKRITSRSRQGLSVVLLEFYWGARMDYASLSVREKLDEMRLLLPLEAERPQVLPLDPSARPIMQIAAYGVELYELSEYCRQVVRRRLEQLPGVAMVEVVGGLEPQILVEFNPQKLLTQSIHPDDVVKALKANNLAVSGGTIRKGRYRYALRVEGEFQGVEDIRQVAVGASQHSPPILLGDIAHVSLLPKERQSLTRLNQQETMGLLLTKEAGSNTVAVSALVQETLRQIERENPGLQFFVVSQQAEFIQQSIDNVMSALLWGGLLAFLVLFLYLHQFRHVFNIAIAIPVSIVTTFLIMHLAGISLNMMSLGGLALGIGLLVDNSIVVLENIFRRREEGAELVAASADGAREVAMPVLASTLTTCAVFLPIIYVEGIAGQLFRDQSLTVVVALFASLLVSLTLLPVLSSRFQGRPRLQSLQDNTYPDIEKSSTARTTRIANMLKRLFESASQSLHAINNALAKITQPFFRRVDQTHAWLYGNYHRFLLFSLGNKRIILTTAVVLFAATLALATRLDQRLLPPLHPDEIRLRLELSPEATLYQTSEVVAAIEERLLADPNLRYVFSQIGAERSLFLAQQEEAPHQATLVIRKGDNSKLNSQQFISRIQSALPGAYQFEHYIEGGEEIYTSILGLGDPDVQVNIQGESSEVLIGVAEQIQSFLRQVNGLRDVQLSFRGSPAQYRIWLDRQTAARLGITVSQVADHIRTKVSGIPATSIKEFDRSIDIVVRPSLEWRQSWEQIYRQLLPSPHQMVPLNEIVHYRRVQVPEEILREDQIETMQVLASLGGATRREVVQQINHYLDSVSMPENVRVQIGGQQREIQQSFSSLRLALLLSVMLVYMILAAQFESLRYPLLIILAVPFGSIGAIWLLWLTGNGLTLISGIGFLVLTGIVVNDAIIKVDFINRARLKGESLRQAILDASRKRFRPILMTTITTVFGLLPMAVAGGSGAELRQPLAIVIIGGLSLATFLTLILIPVLYELISSQSRRSRK